MQSDSSIHQASAVCDVSTETALVFLSDGIKLGEWALGAWATTLVGPGLFKGHSLFDDSPIWVGIDSNPESNRVVYRVGTDPEQLMPRIEARAVPTHPATHKTPRCEVRLFARREASMSDERWLRLVRCHEVEVILIQARLAKAASHVAG